MVNICCSHRSCIIIVFALKNYVFPYLSVGTSGELGWQASTTKWEVSHSMCEAAELCSGERVHVRWHSGCLNIWFILLMHLVQLYCCQVCSDFHHHLLICYAESNKLFLLPHSLSSVRQELWCWFTGYLEWQP